MGSYVYYGCLVYKWVECLFLKILCKILFFIGRGENTEKQMRAMEKDRKNLLINNDK